MLEKKLSFARFFGGLFVFLLFAGIGVALIFAVGRVGMIMLLLSIPGLIIAAAIMSTARRLVHTTCNASLAIVDQTIPFDIASLPDAQQVATSGNAMMLEQMIRQAPLATPPSFCALGAVSCPRCGQAGYLTLATYRFEQGWKMPIVDKQIVEVGAHVGGNVLAMVQQAGAARWRQVTEYTGMRPRIR
jgi:hypothetical protein